MIKTDIFKYGFKSMFPVIPGMIPFGLIMGTVGITSGLSLPETMGLNFLVFGGASQLVAVDLMTKNTSSYLIIFTGIIINLRFILYSAANSVFLKECSFLFKLMGAYLLTDQSYAVTSAKETELRSNTERIHFYFGCGLCMFVFWNLSVLLGCLFGNIVPSSLSLDFAVPLSFMALTIPALKSKSYYFIAIQSLVLSILFINLPFNLGLIVTASLGIFSSYLFIKFKRKI